MGLERIRLRPVSVMGQAKQRQQARVISSAVPRSEIAHAIRTAALGAGLVDGACLQQTIVGARIVRRYGIETRIVAGDFQRPIGRGLVHTYTLDSGLISVPHGAFHAWLHCPATDDVIDFAAWEAPIRCEAQAIAWTGERPDYLWDSVASLARQGYRIRPDEEATRYVRRFAQDPHAMPGAQIDAAAIDAVERAAERSLAGL